MAVEIESSRSAEPELGADFVARLEKSLPKADGDRRRHQIAARAQRLLPLVLLIGPIAGWRLMLASPDGVHLSVEALTWLTFVLDVGVHLNTSILSYLGFQALPTIVGVLLFILVTATLLGHDREER